ncbi:hypothetical protein FH5_03365 [Priestia endophytica]|nr:hypothetical protein FH5_03365 [Priestia endophytica]
MTVVSFATKKGAFCCFVSFSFLVAVSFEHKRLHLLCIVVSYEK